MTSSIQNIYSFLSYKERDEVLTLYEKKNSISAISKAVSEIKNHDVSERAIQEAVIIGYLDEGESQRAEQLVREFLFKKPDIHIHNLLLRCLLSSTNNILQSYFEESLNWAQLYETCGSFSSPVNRSSSKHVNVGLFCNYANTVFGETAIFPMIQKFAVNDINVFLYNFSVSELSIDAITRNIVEKELIYIRNVNQLTIEQLQKQVIEDQIDMLFDLNGRLREDNRLEVFFNKSVPIQINYFNLVGTTGMKSFDYVIADSIVLPEQEEKFYTEKVIRLPCGVNGAFQMLRTTGIGALPYELNGFITFGSFNAFFKFNDQLLVLWSKILNAVPRSKILIKNEEVSRKRVRDKIYSIFSAHGISEDRIILEGFTPLEIMKTRYSKIDIALDTFPYSGGSTTLNALWQGVPPVTLKGTGWRSNTATSMLKSADLEILITYSEEEYFEKAVELSTNIAFLKEIRSYIKDNIKNCPYFRPDIVYPQLANVLKNLHEKESLIKLKK